jgi:hypothetical protein
LAYTDTGRRDTYSAAAPSKLSRRIDDDSGSGSSDGVSHRNCTAIDIDPFSVYFRQSM